MPQFGDSGWDTLSSDSNADEADGWGLSVAVTTGEPLSVNSSQISSIGRPQRGSMKNIAEARSSSPTPSCAIFTAPPELENSK